VHLVDIRRRIEGVLIGWFLGQTSLSNSYALPSLYFVTLICRRRPLSLKIQTRRRDVGTGSGGATSLLGSVSPGLVSGGPPLRFSPPARLFRRVSLCFLVMASVRGLVPCRAAGGGSLRPDLELSLCVEGFVFFAGSIRGCFSSSGHVSFFV
jgi:hypothetical protein